MLEKAVSGYDVLGVNTAKYVVRRIDDQADLYVGDLLDEDGATLAIDRDFPIDGEENPFDELGTDEKALVKGEKPTSSWLKATIQLWLDGQQSPDMDGNVSENDPFYYASDATKSELLALVPEDENETG